MQAKLDPHSKPVDRPGLRSTVSIIALALITIGSIGCNSKPGPVREAISHKDVYKQAYIYGFPMVVNYGTMYEFNINRKLRPIQRSL